MNLSNFNFNFIKPNFKTVKFLLFFAFSVQQINQTTFAAETLFKENAPEWRYSVRPGDNLIRFGKQHLINPDNWLVLQKLNKINNPRHMQHMNSMLHLLNAQSRP